MTKKLDSVRRSLFNEFNGDNLLDAKKTTRASITLKNTYIAAVVILTTAIAAFSKSKIKWANEWINEPQPTICYGHLKENGIKWNAFTFTVCFKNYDMHKRKPKNKLLVNKTTQMISSHNALKWIHDNNDGNGKGSRVVHLFYFFYVCAVKRKKKHKTNR